MGLLTKIGSALVGAPTGNLVGRIADIADEYFHTDEEKAAFLGVLNKAQMNINAIEAGHRTIFVAGWRPYLGWVLGTCILYHFLLRDLANWVIVLVRPEIKSLPPFEHLGLAVSLLVTLLGARTLEKTRGKAV